MNTEQIARDEKTPPFIPKRNELGFREETLPNDILGDNYARILFLGDSFTFGDGIDNTADVFSELTEVRLNEALQDTGTKYHVYNAGVNGSEPKRWLGFLEALLQAYRPQYVFAIFFLRDGTELSTSLRYHKREIQSIRATYENTLWYRWSYIGKHVGDKLVAAEFTKRYFQRMRDSYLGDEEQRRPWLEQQEYLLKIRDKCLQNGIDFHLVIFPLLFGLENGYPFQDVEDEIAAFARANQIPVFSLIEGFRGRKSKDLWVASYDQHPNERGHEIAADTLSPYLKRVVDNEGDR